MAVENPFKDVEPYVGIAEDSAKWDAAIQKHATTAEEGAAATAETTSRTARDWVRNAQLVARGRGFAGVLPEMYSNPMAPEWFEQMTRRGRSGSEGRQAAMKAAQTRMMRENLVG